MKKKIKKIIFVYNAKSGFSSMLIDTIHKTISPKTYPCNLCQITYGIKNMKKDWKKFIDELSIDVEFLHKDEWKKKYPSISYKKFPVVYAVYDTGIEILISHEKINKAKNNIDLQNLITHFLNYNTYINI